MREILTATILGWCGLSFGCASQADPSETSVGSSVAAIISGGGNSFGAAGENCFLNPNGQLICDVDTGAVVPGTGGGGNPGNYAVCSFTHIKGWFNFPVDSLQIDIAAPGQLPNGHWHVWTQTQPGHSDWIEYNYKCIHANELTTFGGFQSVSSGGVLAAHPAPLNQTLTVPTAGFSIAPWSGLEGDFGINDANNASFSQCWADSPSTALTTCTANLDPSNGSISAASTWSTVVPAPIIYPVRYALSDFNNPALSVPLAPVNTSFCYLAGVGNIHGSNYPNADSIDIVQCGSQWCMKKSRAQMRVSATCIALNQ